MNSSRLSEVFHRFERSHGCLIGVEHEKISFALKDGGPVPYHGPSGIHQLLLELCARFGWEPEHTEGYLLSLSRADAHITLEPGGQVELSGAPKASLREVRDELARHLLEVAEAGAAIGIGLSELGMHPLRDPFTVEFIPKPRYAVMRRHFQRTGKRGLYMMGATATVQVNLDFADEAEAMEKLRAGQLASPFVSALFANSPFEHGVDTGEQSRRYATWLDVDPSRQGLLGFLYREDASYAQYIEWALQAPMYGVHRDDTFLAMPGIAFGDFLAGDHGRETSVMQQATMEDWYDHLGTLYPETRLKRTIELRGADSGNLEHSLAVAAIWHGLLDDKAARRRIIAGIDAPAVPSALQAEVAKRGLWAEYAGARAIDYAHFIVKTAKAGLYALGDELADSALQPAEEALCEGLTPADLWRRRTASITHKEDILFVSRYPRP